MSAATQHQQRVQRYPNKRVKAEPPSSPTQKAFDSGDKLVQSMQQAYGGKSSGGAGDESNLAK